jgi:fatty-acyl-CoA synthase
MNRCPGRRTGLLRLIEQGRDVVSQLGDPVGRRAFRIESKAALRALLRIAKLRGAIWHGSLSLWDCLEFWADRRPQSPAIVDENGPLTWRQLRTEAVRWGRVLRQRSIGPATRVAVVAENSTQLIVLLFAIQWIGGSALLLDARCGSDGLASALSVFDTSLLLVDDPEDLEGLAPPHSCTVMTLSELSSASANDETEPSHAGHGARSELFAWLTTSGTTGEPKAVGVSATRAVLAGFGISELCLALSPSDVIFCALPLSHATALLTGLCAALLAGCTLVTRRRFAASAFWSDVANVRATALVYVGELARYLLAAPYDACERSHRLRVAYGNGMALDIWHRFQARFRIPRILELYGATELPLSLVNLGGHPGAIGRTPFGKVSPWRIVRRDAESGRLIRDAQDICIECDPGEAGELVLLARYFSRNRQQDPSQREIAADGQHMQFVSQVVCRTDWGLRTGDIVVRDDNGYIEFVDRTFEVFRQDGRNVSTAYLVRKMRRFAGVAEVGVTHLRLPHYDGHMGLAVIVPTDGFSLAGLERDYNRLAAFEKPRFLRLTAQLRLNRALKFDQAAYRIEGLCPRVPAETMYACVGGHFCRVTPQVRREIDLGQFRF